MQGFKIVPYLRTLPNKHGLHEIVYRVVLKRVSKHVKSEIFIKKSDWNNNKKEVRQSNTDAAIYNNQIKSKFADVEKWLIESEIEKKSRSFSEVVDFLSGKKQKVVRGQTIFSLFEHVATEEREKSSFRTSKKTLNVLKKLKECFDGKDSFLSELNMDYITKFEKFVIGNNRSNEHLNTSYKIVQKLRTVIKKGISLDYLEYDPFVKYRAKTVKTKKSFISEEDIKLIENLELDPTKKIFHARNLFIMAYYCMGVRISDMLLLKKENIVGDRLYYKMSKTGVKKDIKLAEQAKKILSYYPDLKPGQYIFPFLQNGVEKGDTEYLLKQLESKTQIVNKSLQTIREMAGISTKITTHIARHSFASNSFKNTKDVYSVSKALGHNDVKVTEVYLRSLEQEVQDDLIDKMFG